MLRSLLFATSVVSLLGSLCAQDCLPEKSATPSTPVPIRRVIFQNAPNLSREARREIAKALLDETVYAGSVSADMTRSADEASERVRAAYQNEGYFKAQVSTTAVPVAKEAAVRYDVVIRTLSEGMQYRLGDMQFTHMTAFPEQQLRDVFLIQRGEVFSREKIAKGLEELRRLYGREGYINFTAVPDTVLDENNNSINLEIDVDEGKQFRLRSLEVFGVDSETKARVLSELAIKPGDIYNAELWERSMEKFPNLIQDPDTAAKRLDERDGWVDAIIDFRKPDPCPIDRLAPEL